MKEIELFASGKLYINRHSEIRRGMVNDEMLG